MARLAYTIDQQFFDDVGAVLAGGKVYFYEPGTTTTRTTWKDAAEATAQAQPVVLDATGRPASPIYVEGIYDIKITTSADVQVGNTITNWGDPHTAIAGDDPGNLVQNYSMEKDEDSDNEVDNWAFTESTGTWARVTSAQAHGAASLKGTGVDNTDFADTAVFPVSPNESYTMQFEYYTSNASAQPRMEIYWLDKDQAAVSNEQLFGVATGTAAVAWTLVEGINVTPPSTARHAKIRYYNDSASAYDLYLDNMKFTAKLSESSPYVPHGLQISHDTDTAHDLNITAGSVKSDDFADNMVLGTEITKQADATWAQGDDAGGYESGGSIPASGIFYIWLIKKATTGDVDVLFSDSATSPTMPSGWGVKRYIGAALTDSSNNIVSAAWKGEYYYPLVLVTEVDDTTLTTSTYETATINAPPTSEFKGELFADANGDYATEFRCFFRRTGSTATHGMGVDDTDPAGGGLDNVQGEMHVLLDSSSRVDYAVFFQASASPPLNLKVYNKGWTDLLRLYP